ncbi:MAG: hypothetical protein KDB45_11120 [Mycobacterium sp.]|nr:hypothetical protein [Mycobacterium sp.]
MTTVTAVDSAPSSSVATVTAGRERPCGTLGRSAAALTTVACSSVIGVATKAAAATLSYPQLGECPATGTTGSGGAVF